MKYCFFIFFIIICTSCNDDSKEFTGYFKNTNPTAFTSELKIRQIHDKTYQISSGNEFLVYEGIRNGFRITAKLKPDPNMLIAGIEQDKTSFYYDFDAGCNQITKSSADMNHVETFIRVEYVTNNQPTY